MDLDFYANGVKKTSGSFPLFTDSNRSADDRVFIQIPDDNDYGQLTGYADTINTDIYETSADNLYLLKQDLYSYIVPNYNTSGVDFDYYITNIYNRSLIIILWLLMV